MKAKQKALSDIVKLVKKHSLTKREVIDAIAHADHSEHIVMKLFAYLGGIFVFAGIIVYISMFWFDMGSFFRVLLTLGSGVVIYFIALLLLYEKKYQKAITPLIIISAFLMPAGLFVMLKEYFGGGDWHLPATCIFFGMMILQLLTYLFYHKHSFIFNSIVFGVLLVATIIDWVNLGDEMGRAILGVGTIAVAFLVNKNLNRMIAAFWFLFGSFMLFFGVFELLEGTIYEETYVLVTGAIIWLSSYTRSRVLLTTGALALFGYIGYYTQMHFVDSYGWPIGLVILGITFFIISYMVFKLQQMYVK